MAKKKTKKATKKAVKKTTKTTTKKSTPAKKTKKASPVKKAAKKKAATKKPVKKASKKAVKKTASLKKTASKTASKATTKSQTAAQPQQASAGAGAERMFEFHDGKADKFWAIKLQGTAHTVRYGRSGTDGQSKTKDFGDIGKARKDYDKLIAQKTGKGYTEVLDQSQSRSAKVIENKQAMKAHEPFFNAILEDPDDLTNYGVYADWLSENSDPRGEFIHLQLQLEDETLKAAERKKLKAAEAKLLKANQATWLGDLHEHLTLGGTPEMLEDDLDGHYKFTFARGFLDTLFIGDLMPPIAKALKDSVHARMLRQLVIRDIAWGYQLAETSLYADANLDEDSQPGIEAMSGIKFDNLRYFEVSEEEPVEREYYRSHLRGENLHNLVKNMPMLEALHLEAHRIANDKIFKLSLPHLRSMTIHHSYKYPLEVLANNKSLANLESICFYPHAHEPWDEGAYIVAKGFKAICKSKNLPSLRSIDLRGTDVGNEGIKEFVKSPMLHQIKELNLSHGCINDEGAKILAGADLSGLERLILDNNYLSNAGIEMLEATGVNLNAESQFSGAPDDDYEYLWHGDIE